MKPKVYLAGKITNNWWRNEILGSCGDKRTNGINVPNYLMGENIEDYYDEYWCRMYDAGEFIVTGPHSIGCDHGCAHSDNAKHASSKECENSCMQDFGIPNEFIYEACISQIKKSDIIFAYIDSEDCYGTLFEIGYAVALRKKVYIVYKNEKLAQLHWFIKEGALHTGCNQIYILDSDIDKKKTLKDIFNEIIKSRNK